MPKGSIRLRQRVALEAQKDIDRLGYSHGGATLQAHRVMRRPRGGQSILEPCTIGPVVQRVVLAFERLQPRVVSCVDRTDRRTPYCFFQIMPPVALRLRAGPVLR